MSGVEWGVLMAGGSLGHPMAACREAFLLSIHEVLTWSAGLEVLEVPAGLVVVLLDINERNPLGFLPALQEQNRDIFI